jgi:putative hydrolase of the HAD superfamily
MKYQAVFFDLFGTLVRNFSTQEYQEILKQMAGLLNVPLPDFLKLWWETASERYTGGLDKIETSIKLIGQKKGLSLEKAQIDRVIEIRLEYIRNMLQPREYAVEVLTQLRSRQYKIGLISDSSIEIPLVWGKSPLANLFDVTVFSCEVGMKKPDPRIYALATARLGVKPGDSLFIGDGGSRELTGAADAGLHAVMIQPYGESELPQANSEFREWSGPKIYSLLEVLDLIGEKESYQ